MGKWNKNKFKEWRNKAKKFKHLQNRTNIQGLVKHNKKFNEGRNK